MGSGGRRGHGPAGRFSPAAAFSGERQPAHRRGRGQQQARRSRPTTCGSWATRSGSFPSRPPVRRSPTYLGLRGLDGRGLPLARRGPRPARRLAGLAGVELHHEPASFGGRRPGPLARRRPGHGEPRRTRRGRRTARGRVGRGVLGAGERPGRRSRSPTPLRLRRRRRSTSPGSYVLRLTASDSQASASDEVVVEVRAVNHAPLAEAGPDVAGLAPGATITLQGSVSDDGLPDGALTVTWSQVSGPVPAAIVSPSLVTTLATLPRRWRLRPAPDGQRRRAGRDRRPGRRGHAPQPGAARQRRTRSRARGSRRESWRWPERCRTTAGPRERSPCSGRRADPARSCSATPAAVATTARFGAPGTLRAEARGERRRPVVCPTRPPSSSGRPASSPT